MRRSTASTNGERTPSRRELLRRGGITVATLALLSGCTESMGEEFPPNTKFPISELVPELPVTQQTAIFEERIVAMSNLEIEDSAAFVTALDDAGLDGVTIGDDADVLTLSYILTPSRERGLAHDVGSIAGAYAALVDSGFESIAIEITILDPEGRSFGVAEIPTWWTDRYLDGQWSPKEYGEMVADTIESRREPPEVEVDAGE